MATLAADVVNCSMHSQNPPGWGLSLGPWSRWSYSGCNCPTRCRAGAGQRWQFLLETPKEEERYAQVATRWFRHAPLACGSDASSSRPGSGTGAPHLPAAFRATKKTHKALLEVIPRLVGTRLVSAPSGSRWPSSPPVTTTCPWRRVGSLLPAQRHHPPRMAPRLAGGEDPAGFELFKLARRETRPDLPPLLTTLCIGSDPFALPGIRMASTASSDQTITSQAARMRGMKWLATMAWPTSAR